MLAAYDVLQRLHEFSALVLLRGLLSARDTVASQEQSRSEITIQVHRGQIMRKMAASSLADLVKMAGKLGIS